MWGACEILLAAAVVVAKYYSCHYDLKSVPDRIAIIQQVCVLDAKLMFPPIYIQLNQYPCQCRALRPQIIRQRYTLQMQQASKVMWSCNATANEQEKGGK